jgi:uncharacterized protein (DUF433 family)
MAGGAGYGEIRVTIRSLRDRFGHEWPLSHAQLAVAPGGHIVAAADEALYDIGRLGWQQVTPESLSNIVGLLQNGGWAARELRDLQYIEVNPRILSGTPTIRGRRLPVAKVAHLASSHRGLRALKSDYDLSDVEIDDAQRWWRQTETYGQAA